MNVFTKVCLQTLMCVLWKQLFVVYCTVSTNVERCTFNLHLICDLWLVIS